MTREDVIRNWDVIEAFRNGADIESRAIGLREWRDKKNPLFDFSSFEYRIKPNTEYVPFDFSDGQQLLGKIVIAKNENFVGIIVSVAQNSLYIGACIGSYKTLMENFTFADGTPCGKLKTK